MRWDPVLQDYVKVAPRFENGMSFDRSYDNLKFSKVILPSTLRFLGGESFISYHFSEFTLPASLEGIDGYAFGYCTIDVLRIEAVIPPDELRSALSEAFVSAYEVPEDHPLYKAVDGVLFSKDGKTLLDYPARMDMHYDVPRGVEHIAGRARCPQVIHRYSTGYAQLYPQAARSAIDGRN